MASTVTAIESPCIKVCVVHPVEKLCTGCGRSLEEISQWINLGAAERKRIMAVLPMRLKTMTASVAKV